MTDRQIEIFRWMKQEAERTKMPVGRKQVAQQFIYLSNYVITNTIKTLQKEGYIRQGLTGKYIILRTI